MNDQASNGPAENPLRAYFDIYHCHFERFRGQPCKIVEVGVFHGGSLQMWRDHLGPQARIIGIDINPRLRDLGEPGIEIIIGDQGDRGFLRQFAKQVGPIDILLDDGGHLMHQQIATVEELYGNIKPDGVILSVFEPRVSARGSGRIGSGGFERVLALDPDDAHSIVAIPLAAPRSLNFAMFGDRLPGRDCLK